ncbi:MAG TPA: hypothetical protein V6D22_06005 [Candidatus Obscuribacterales bacterium]
MKATIGLIAALALAAAGSTWSSARAQTMDTNSNGMLGTRTLPHTEFYHHPQFIDIVRTGPIVHYPTDPEPAQPVLIDGQIVPIPQSSAAGLTTVQPVHAQTVNPMLGNRQLPISAFGSNIPAGGIPAPAANLQKGSSIGVHTNMRPPAYPRASFISMPPPKAATQKGLPAVEPGSSRQVFKYPDLLSQAHSSGAGGAITSVHATITRKLLEQAP